MNNLQQFLTEYRENCAKLMVEVVDYMLAEGYSTVSQIEALLAEATQIRDSFPKFDSTYMIHWSYMTYITDVRDCFLRSKYYTNQGVTP